MDMLKKKSKIGPINSLRGFPSPTRVRYVSTGVCTYLDPEPRIKTTSQLLLEALCHSYRGGKFFLSQTVPPPSPSLSPKLPPPLMKPITGTFGVTLRLVPPILAPKLARPSGPTEIGLPLNEGAVTIGFGLSCLFEAGVIDGSWNAVITGLLNILGSKLDAGGVPALLDAGGVAGVMAAVFTTGGATVFAVDPVPDAEKIPLFTNWLPVASKVGIFPMGDAVVPIVDGFVAKAVSTTGVIGAGGVMGAAAGWVPINAAAPASPTLGAPPPVSELAIFVAPDPCKVSALSPPPSPVIISE